MYERLGLEQRDLRNMAIVVGVMTLVMLVVLDGPLIARLVAAIVFGVVSATAFLLVTILLNTVKPEY
jgi:hypothetical protein